MLASQLSVHTMTVACTPFWVHSTFCTCFYTVEHFGTTLFVCHVECSDEDEKRAAVCRQLKLVPLLLTLLDDPSIKSSDQLQLIVTLCHCLEGSGLSLRLFCALLSLQECLCFSCSSACMHSML